MDWTSIPTSRRVVALTFDAGANADEVASILATLRGEQVPATFLLTGNFVRDFPSAAHAIAAAGERIGDHTVSHPYLGSSPDDHTTFDADALTQVIREVRARGYSFVTLDTLTG